VLLVLEAVGFFLLIVIPHSAVIAVFTLDKFVRGLFPSSPIAPRLSGVDWPAADVRRTRARRVPPRIVDALTMKDATPSDCGKHGIDPGIFPLRLATIVWRA